MYASISLNFSQYYVPDKSKHAYYVQKFFQKIVPFMRECGEVWYSQTGHS